MADDKIGLILSSESNSYQAISSSQPQTNAAGGSRQKTIHVYKRRWYILLVYSLVTAIQGYVVNVWAVIAATVEVTFKWTDHDITLISNWNSITYLIAIVPFSWITMTKGFRLATLLSSGLVMVGCILRCCSFTPPAVTWLAHISQVACGLAGPLSFSGAVILSDRWFPINERATATAIGTIVSFIGSTICYLTGPLGVRELLPDKANQTDINSAIKEISILRYAECATAALTVVLVLIYFPDRPPLPPSVSASVSTETQMPFIPAVKRLFRFRENSAFWLISVAWAIFGGVSTVWAGLIDVILKPIGVSQEDAGWFGFYGGVAGCITAVLAGRLADFLIGRMKPILLIFIVLSTLACYWNLLLAQPYITYDRASMMAVSILCGAAQNAVSPLFLEMAVESAYPVPGATSAGAATILYELPISATLVILSIPNLSIRWINWCQFLACWVAFPLILAAKERYRRLEVDRQHTKTIGAQPSPGSSTITQTKI